MREREGGAGGKGKRGHGIEAWRELEGKSAGGDEWRRKISRYSGLTLIYSWVRFRVRPEKIL